MENGNPIHGNVGKHRHRTVGFGVNPNDGKAYCAVCGKRITSVSTSGIAALAISLMLVIVLLTLFGPLTVKALEFFMNPLLAVFVLALALILDMRFGRCYCEGEELYDELRTQFGYICSDTLADEMAYNYAWLYNDGRIPTLEFESVCFTTVKTEYIGKDEPVTQKFVVVNTPERQSYWLMFSNGTLQAIYEGTPYGERLFMVIK